MLCFKSASAILSICSLFIACEMQLCSVHSFCFGGLSFFFFYSTVPPAYYAHLAAFRARYYMESDELSDGGSTSAGGSRSVVRQLPLIKQNVQEVMFFC
ncbi:hypothetical protein BHM03_00003220 [Ensete ventricosum]|nr:hypothetical protein BHM03_00003220 [Ensete ventricosum]